MPNNAEQVPVTQKDRDAAKALSELAGFKFAADHLDMMLDATAEAFARHITEQTEQPLTELQRLGQKFDAEEGRLPEIGAVFETVGAGVVGTKRAAVSRVERQDDGTLTVVIDHWCATEQSRPSQDVVALATCGLDKISPKFAIEREGQAIAWTDDADLARQISAALTQPDTTTKGQSDE